MVKGKRKIIVLVTDNQGNTGESAEMLKIQSNYKLTYTS